MDRPRTPEIGFADPVDPQPHELKAWAYDPAAVAPNALPSNWDLLVAGDHLAPTLFDLAMDPRCQARRFALHCLYIYAAETARPHANPGRRRKQRLRQLVDRAQHDGDELMAGWAHNVRVLQGYPQVFSHPDWLEGGLVRNPVRLNPYQ